MYQDRIRPRDSPSTRKRPTFRNELSFGLAFFPSGVVFFVVVCILFFLTKNPPGAPFARTRHLHLRCALVAFIQCRIFCFVLWDKHSLAGSFLMCPLLVTALQMHTITVSRSPGQRGFGEPSGQGYGANPCLTPEMERRTDGCSRPERTHRSAPLGGIFQFIFIFFYYYYLVRFPLSHTNGLVRFIRTQESCPFWVLY